MTERPETERHGPEQYDGRLVAAVRAGDADAVRALLEAGADPDTTDTDGLPVLCTAVAAFAHEVAEVLVQGGADPDRELPDGTTPLLRAVEGGSPAVVGAIRGDVALRLSQVQRERLLAAARRWYRTGAEAELRRRTGEQGPARTVSVPEEEFRVEEVTLGGRTVRAGHGAVLTTLEWAFGMPAPVEELMGRAARVADADHVDWSASCWNLAGRLSAETWLQVVAFHRHPSPVHRAFVADFLRFGALLHGMYSQHPRWYERERCRVLAAWAEEETDGAVLAAVLDAVSFDDIPESHALGLLHAGHPDPRVRRMVPRLFDEPLTGGAAAAVRALAGDPVPEVRAAAAEALGSGEALTDEDRGLVTALLRDPDLQVRDAASYAVARGRDRSPAVTEALFALLDADEQQVRLNCAYGLALRDDPRTPEAYGRVGPLGPEYEDDFRSDGLWRWRMRNEDGRRSRQPSGGSGGQPSGGSAG
ncbi:ankyrin repeat domain-containing protein [Streptomyces sp. NPDC048603]|uniref:ankyrin repeat domain-containing protein n=1 Tax=Streptomyces sp. NPDC048603 TaxID=3365577 RepID=UPI003716C9CE